MSKKYNYSSKRLWYLVKSWVKSFVVVHPMMSLDPVSYAVLLLKNALSKPVENQE